MTDAHIEKILNAIRVVRIWTSLPIWLALKRLWKMTTTLISLAMWIP